MHTFKRGAALCAVALGLVTGGAHAQEKELRIGYQPNPIQTAAVELLEKWGKANGVKIIKVPNSYGVYLEKMTSALTSGSDQFDVIWHNDDWGQLWAHMLEPVDDVKGIENVDPFASAGIIFNNAEGRNTFVPMAHTYGVFFYRTDLVKPDEVPQTWDELVKVSKRLQAENKVKYGFVGSMSMNNSWNTWFWSMWANNCDVLTPTYERSNAVLKQNGWKSGMTDQCMREVAEFWWDAINTHKISPKGMPAYDRNEANAIFTSGNSAFTVSDSSNWGSFDDPAKSKIAGKVGVGFLPLGPSRKEHISWNDAWGWAIPKSATPERKALAKQMLSGMLQDEQGQIELFAKTGAPPPNMKLWDKIAAVNPKMVELKKHSLDVPFQIHGGYYFEAWPAVHKAFSDAAIKSVVGKREDIPKALAEGAPLVTQAAQ